MIERLRWAEAPIVAIASETPTVKRFTLRTPWTQPFRAGQHVDVRLTAPDGYQAQRSYSIASGPSSVPLIDLMVERLEDGEVSPFFHEVAAVGDTVELRGPIGGPFTWMPEDGGPLLLAGGGSGVVPLLSMLRARGDVGTRTRAALLYSARRGEDVIAREELLARAAADPSLALRLHLTRDDAPAAERPGRIDAAAVADALGWLGDTPLCFVCGSQPFVGHLSDLLLDAGVPAARIRTERFG